MQKILLGVVSGALMFGVVVGLIALGEDQAHHVAWGVLAAAFICQVAIGFGVISGRDGRQQHNGAQVLFLVVAAAMSAGLTTVLSFALGRFLRIPLSHEVATLLVVGSAGGYCLLLAFANKHYGLARRLPDAFCAPKSITSVSRTLGGGASKQAR